MSFSQFVKCTSKRTRGDAAGTRKYYAPYTAVARFFTFHGLYRLPLDFMAENYNTACVHDLTCCEVDQFSNIPANNNA